MKFNLFIFTFFLLLLFKSHAYPPQTFLRNSSPKHIQLIFKKFLVWNENKFADDFKVLPSDFKKNLMHQISKINQWEINSFNNFPVKPIQFIYQLEENKMSLFEILYFTPNRDPNLPIGHGYNFKNKKSFEIHQLKSSPSHQLQFIKKHQSQVLEKFQSVAEYKSQNNIEELSRKYADITIGDQIEFLLFRTNGLPPDALPGPLKDFADEVLHNFMFHINEIYYQDKVPKRLAYP